MKRKWSRKRRKRTKEIRTTPFFDEQIWEKGELINKLFETIRSTDNNDNCIIERKDDSFDKKPYLFSSGIFYCNCNNDIHFSTEGMKIGKSKNSSMLEEMIGEAESLIDKYLKLQKQQDLLSAHLASLLSEIENEIDYQAKSIDDETIKAQFTSKYRKIVHERVGQPIIDLVLKRAITLLRKDG